MNQIVAQVSNLLYCPLPAGKASAIPAATGCFNACGLEIRDTADGKAALQAGARSWAQSA